MSEVRYGTIEGFSAYRFGSDGSVWTCFKRQGVPGKVGSVSVKSDEWRQLKTPLDAHGYQQVNLVRDDGRIIHRQVHPLILTAFVGARPDGMECCHGDGCRSNNRIENLRWDTRKANQADALKHGTRGHGENSPSPKLTWDKVSQAKKLSADGKSFNEIGALLGVGGKAIANAVRGKTWNYSAVLG